MTTLSSKILTGDKEHFAALAVDAVLRLKGSGNLEAIQLIKKPGGTLKVGWGGVGWGGGRVVEGDACFLTESHQESFQTTP
jgi:hypothetical protein